MNKKINDREDGSEALEFATSILSIRDHSEKEISERLDSKGFSKSAIQFSLEELKRKNLIDDSRFSDHFSESKIKKGWSNQRIQEELARKGVSTHTIQQALLRIERDSFHSNPGEEERAYQLVLKRCEQLKDLDSRTLYRRCYEALWRKGFSEELIEKTLNRYSREQRALKTVPLSKEETDE